MATSWVAANALCSMMISGKQTEFVREVDRHGKASVAIMPICVSEDPQPPAAQAVRRQRVDEGACEPLERPRQVKRPNERADGRRPESLPAHLRCDRRGRESERDALGGVEQKKSG